MSKIFFLSNIFQNHTAKTKNINKGQAYEVGYDVLANKLNINDPPNNIKRANIFFINTEPNLMAKLNGKLDLGESDVDVIQNSGAGNCFYKSISQFYLETENYHLYYRKQIAEYIESKKATDSINYPYLYKNEKDILTWHEYFDELKLTGTYAGQYELINTSLLCNCNIIVYRNNHYNIKDRNYNFTFETIINKYDDIINPFSPIILLGWVNNNHYVLLVPKNFQINNVDNNIRNNNINTFKKGDNKNTINSKKNKTISKNLKKESSEFADDSSKNNEKNGNYIEMNIKFKKFLTTYVNNEKSIYPEIKGTKSGETKLQDIYNYLQSEIQSPNNKKWPSYIEDAIKHNKNLESKEKGKYTYSSQDKSKNLGRPKGNAEKIEKNIYNIKNMKKGFRTSAKSYKLNNKGELLYIRSYKEKDKLTKKIIETKYELRVPTVSELNEKLYEYHAEHFHCNYKDVQDLFKQNKIGFYGLNSLIEEYVSNCPVCVQSSRTIHRTDQVKSINVNGPNIRYEFDLTYLNNDLAEAFGVKMILSVIDVFSRKAMIYKANDKKSDNLIKDILEFCANNSFPKEFCSDNGPEFKNSKINEICEKEGITYIHGIPYNPHSQGTVERFHYTIKKYLAKEYINNGYKKLDFDAVRIKVINFYNNKKHRLIGMTPMEASKITDEETINKINDLKKNEFENINKKRTYLETNATCLLNPKLILIGKNTLIPNYVKKGKLLEKIPVRIVKNSSYGYYQIRISSNYKKGKLNLKAGEEYVCDSKLLKKINEKTWKAIIKKKK